MLIYSKYFFVILIGSWDWTRNLKIILLGKLSNQTPHPLWFLSTHEIFLFIVISDVFSGGDYLFHRLSILANAPAQPKTLKQAPAGIRLHVNAHKTECMCLNERDDISTLNGTTLKLVDKFTNLESSVSSIETDINTTSNGMDSCDRLSVI